MYGVVRCSRCGRPQGVDLSAQTHGCACGQRLNLEELKPLFTTEDPRELPAALGRVRAELADATEGYQADLTGGRAPPVRPSDRARLPARVRRKRTLEVLEDLAGEEGFTLEEAAEVLEALGLGDEGILDALRRENLLYEASRGRFHLV